MYLHEFALGSLGEKQWNIFKIKCHERRNLPSENRLNLCSHFNRCNFHLWVKTELAINRKRKEGKKCSEKSKQVWKAQKGKVGHRKTFSPADGTYSGTFSHSYWHGYNWIKNPSPYIETFNSHSILLTIQLSSIYIDVYIYTSCIYLYIQVSSKQVALMVPFPCILLSYIYAPFNLILAISVVYNLVSLLCFQKLANNWCALQKTFWLFPVQWQCVRRGYRWWESKCSQNGVLKKGESKSLIATNL